MVFLPSGSDIPCDTGLLFFALLVGIGGGVLMGRGGLTSPLPLAGVVKSSPFSSGGIELKIGAVLV